jgi:multicomponent Na+:H+ antiporter subunit F
VNVHPVVFHASAIWMTILAGICIAMIVRPSSAALVRILVLDLLTMVVIGLLLLYATSRGIESLIDVALAIAILSFLGTLAAARFHSRGSLFR